MVQTASQMLPLGTTAPAFALPDPSGRSVTLDESAGKKATLVVFMCNHCPYVKHVREELARIGRDYQAQSVAMLMNLDKASMLSGSRVTVRGQPRMTASWRTPRIARSA